MPQLRDIDGIWYGLAASVAVHLAAAGAVWRSGASSPEASVRPAPPHREMDLVRLGLEKSDHATINWLGFADPTPHKAMPSEVEQAALSRAPMGEPTPEAAASTRPTEPQPEPVVEAADPVEPTPEQEEQAEQAGRRVSKAGQAQLQPPAPTPDDPWRPASKSVDFLPPPPATRNTPQPPTKQPPEKPREPAEKPDANPASAAPVRVGPTTPAGADDLPGLPSDRESTPTAKRPALTLNDWGKPAAGEGIEVFPRRPRWGPTLYSLAWPRNPTVIIEFGRDGHVRRARFAEIDGKRLDTGTPEVDRVLLNTIYNWTAKGKQIEALAAEGPGSTLAIRMDIKLRW